MVLITELITLLTTGVAPGSPFRGTVSRVLSPVINGY